MLRCRDWPGLQCVDALVEGKPLEGYWRDRSLEYEARRRGKEVDPETFIKRYTLKLDPLPVGDIYQRKISADGSSARRRVIDPRG